MVFHCSFLKTSVVSQELTCEIDFPVLVSENERYFFNIRVVSFKRMQSLGIGRLISKPDADFSKPALFCQKGHRKAKTNGRYRDRTDDLYRVKVALIPTELSARESSSNYKARLTGCQPSLSR
jgi:hypothetical protein